MGCWYVGKRFIVNSDICMSEIRGLRGRWGPFQNCLFGPPADYLKGPLARRVVARILATGAIKVHPEVTRGAPRLHFARG